MNNFLSIGIKPFQSFINTSRISKKAIIISGITVIAAVSVISYYYFNLPKLENPLPTNKLPEDVKQLSASVSTLRRELDDIRRQVLSITNKVGDVNQEVSSLKDTVVNIHNEVKLGLDQLSSKTRAHNETISDQIHSLISVTLLLEEMLIKLKEINTFNSELKSITHEHFDITKLMAQILFNNTQIPLGNQSHLAFQDL